jgi:hypothetical protein
MTDPKQPEAVMVSVMNHGNVDLAQLPVPEGSKSIYAGPASALFVTDSPVAVTREAVRKLLEGQGWEPYGEAGETSYYKRNAVRLLATIGAAPAQGGRTTISYATEQLSADLPAPRETVAAQYADANKQLFFDSKLTKSQVAEFYREALGRSGWKPTTEKPVDSPMGASLVFRNLARDLITLEIQPVNGLQRVLIRHQAAAEVADQERLAKIAAERMSREKEQEARKLTIELPKDAQEVEATEDQVEFTLAAGKARAAVEVLRGTLKQAGWTEADSRLEAMFGNILLTKDKARVTLTYIETGIMPAEVTITAFGVKLERSGRN